jgi:hypothetical protein
LVCVVPALHLILTPTGTSCILSRRLGLEIRHSVEQLSRRRSCRVGRSMPDADMATILNMLEGSV